MDGGFTGTFDGKNYTEIDGTKVKSGIKITGGSKASTLIGGKSNDTLVGGKGADIFVYNAGNDVIQSYESQDKIKVGNGTVSDVTISKKNVVLKVGKKTLTVANAKSADITVIDESGTKIISGGNIYDKKKVSVTLGSAASGTIDLSKLGVKNADASLSSKGVKMSGTTAANKLFGGTGNDLLKGGKGNDTLWGGSGNDSLYGGSGKDTFIYKPGEGTDTIFDYESGDMLKILNADGSQGKFKKSKYSGGDLTLTINGGGKVVFDNVSTGDKFNINGTNYTIKGKSLVSK